MLVGEENSIKGCGMKRWDEFEEEERWGEGSRDKEEQPIEMKIEKNKFIWKFCGYMGMVRCFTKWPLRVEYNI